MIKAAVLFLVLFLAGLGAVDTAGAGIGSRLIADLGGPGPFNPIPPDENAARPNGA
jgi:hypothetical protein